MHGAQNIFSGSDQTHIDRIARNILTRPRHHRTSGEPLLVLVVSPAEREHYVGDNLQATRIAATPTSAIFSFARRRAIGSHHHPTLVVGRPNSWWRARVLQLKGQQTLRIF